MSRVRGERRKEAKQSAHSARTHPKRKKNEIAGAGVFAGLHSPQTTTFSQHLKTPSIPAKRNASEHASKPVEVRVAFPANEKRDR
jgi:hypothetical protein